jgi:hypothetical protein
MIFRWFGLLVVCGLVLVLVSCADPQELVSIQVQPGTETFGSSTTPVAALAGATVQLRALGSYLHPPVTKDITNQVTWSSNTPEMVTVNSTGLITVTGGPCGGTLISATVQTNSDGSGVSSSGAVVTGYMTADVTCYTGNGSSGGGGTSEPTVTVTFPGSGSGTVTSSPLGVSCASTATSCVGGFPVGTDVTLTETAFGTFGGWSGACSGTGTTCTINNLTADVAVAATFN